MKIEPRTFRERDIASVTNLYNNLVSEIPCNWPVTEAEFRDEVMGTGRLSNPDLPFNPGNLLVAWINGSAVGFVHFAVLQEPVIIDAANATYETSDVETNSGSKKDFGLIRFLTFPERQPDIGDSLLNAAADSLRNSGCVRIEAWQMKNGYPFYTARHGGCWEQSRIANLFLSYGFENYHREVVFHRAIDFGFAPPEKPNGTRIVKTEEDFGHGILHQYKIMDGQVMAAQTSWHRMNALSRHPLSHNYGYIQHVSTAETHRRQGFGSILMQEMIADMHNAGITETALHTMFGNIPAIGLYTKSGFRYIGTNIIFRKSLDTED